MKHRSSLIGEFEYREDQVITFPKGLLGFQDYTRYVLKTSAKTGLIKWLVSVEDGGPCFAVVEPHILDDRCGLSKMHIGRETLAKLGAKSADELKMLAVVTIPDDIRQVSMNLRAPLLICPKTRRGLQRQENEIKTRTVRHPIYRELTGDTVDKTNGQLVLLRKLNETIRIGDDIEIEVIALDDGGVRLGVRAPKDVPILRGINNVSPERQMIIAAEDASPLAAAELMKMTHEPVKAAV